jgi:hypothetical protein
MFQTLLPLGLGTFVVMPSHNLEFSNSDEGSCWHDCWCYWPLSYAITVWFHVVIGYTWVFYWIIIIIIIIIMVYVQRFSWFSSSMGHWSSTSYLLFYTTLSNYTACVKCTAFCMWRLSCFKLSCSFFIIPVVDNTNSTVDNTNGTMWTVCSCHILFSLSFRPVYFWSFSVMVLQMLRLSYHHRQQQQRQQRFPTS